jgi:hypothetical protein
MYSAARTAIVAATMAAGVACAQAGADTASIQAQANAGQPLSYADLRDIYSNSTWKWGRQSGGYFASEGQKFTGVSVERHSAAHAEGSWFLPGEGSLCFKATWKPWNSTRRSTTKLDCFEHRRAGDTIYQRARGGDWYVFRHATPVSWEENQKVKRGNHVRRVYEQLASGG